MAATAKRLSPGLRHVTVLFLLWFGGLAFAQTSPAKGSAQRATPKKTSSATAAPKLTPEQERGLRLLKSAEAEAAGLEPDMHAFVLWRVASAYKKIDPKKAERVSADAFTATQAIEDPSDHDQCGPIGSAGDIKSWVQERVLAGMIEKQKIAQAEQLLPQATEPVRDRITKTLVRHYAKEKNYSHAEMLLTQLADSNDYPFDAAGDLILALGPELSADKMTIFSQAISNFEQHKQRQTMGPADVGDFIERTWTKVPSGMVLEAISKLLDEAKSSENKSHYSMASASGTVVLNSSYEMRLFQLLPVLQEVDKDKAEELLRDNAEAKAEIAKYPQGMQSLRTKGDIYSFGITDSDAPQAAEVAAQDEGLAQLNQRINRISEECSKDPAQAMADALGLPINLDSRSPRAQMLAQIAERSVRTNPPVAKSALNELIKIQDEVPLHASADLSNVPEIYLDLGDTDGAEKALKALLKAAEKVYAHDTDADDPNKAFKGTWPSADMWRKCVQVAAKISPVISEEIIGNIPDPDIAAAEKVAFASSLLGETSEESILVSDCRKTHSSFYTSAPN